MIYYLCHDWEYQAFIWGVGTGLVAYLFMHVTYMIFRDWNIVNHNGDSK